MTPVPSLVSDNHDQWVMNDSRVDRTKVRDCATHTGSKIHEDALVQAEGARKKPQGEPQAPGCLPAPSEQPTGTCVIKGHHTSPQGSPTLGTPGCHQPHCAQMGPLHGPPLTSVPPGYINFWWNLRSVEAKVTLNLPFPERPRAHSEPSLIPYYREQQLRKAEQKTGH